MSEKRKENTGYDLAREVPEQETCIQVTKNRSPRFHVIPPLAPDCAAAYQAMGEICIRIITAAK